MKKRKRTFVGVMLMGITLFSAGCTGSLVNEIGGSGIASADGERSVSKKAKEYWYDGTAEITSYKLLQARYGEMREGTAALLYVTEPFSTSSNTKADERRSDNVPVLKMNAMKNFNTGIYPYSLMTSTFFPFEDANKSLKIGFSMQEWCGTMYAEMRNQKGSLIFDLSSYFEGESFKNKKVKATYLEDDIWSLIRLNPEELPMGETDMIPSMAYMRMKHVPLKSYKVTLSKAENKDGTFTYFMNFNELKRTVAIRYEGSFPYAIVKWEETYLDGGKELTTTAERIKQIKSAYWGKSSNSDAYLRTELGLDK